MNTTSPATELVRNAFASPTRGVIGLVDDLLAATRHAPLRMEWRHGLCRVQFGDDAWIEAPLPRSVVRAALARVAVLCNTFKRDSVSPYGGAGKLIAPHDPGSLIAVRFTNTPSEQRLTLRGDRKTCTRAFRALE